MFVSVELVLQTTRLFLVRVRRASPDYRVKQTADAVFPRRRTAPLLPASSTRSCPSCPSSRRSSASLCRPECATSTSSRPASTTSPSSSSASAPSSSSGGTRPARPHRSRSWPTRQAAWSTSSLASCDVCSQRDPVMPSCRRACFEPALRALPGCRCARGVRRGRRYTTCVYGELVGGGARRSKRCSVPVLVSRGATSCSRRGASAEGRSGLGSNQAGL